MGTIRKGAIGATLLIAMAGLAVANFATTEDAINYRKAVMTVIGEHFGQIAAVATGQSPFNAHSLAKHTMVLRTMATLPWEACLMPGSHKGKTTLRKTALKEKDDFMAMARQFEALTTTLDDTVASGDQEAVKGQFGDVAKSCKDCHVAYRKL